MIKETYCSYELAKLLKEKGFNESCDNYYDQSSDEPQQLTLDEMYYSYDEFIKAPTHQMAMKWLREVHKVLIVIDAYHANHWEGYIDSFEISIYSHASTIIVPNEIAYHTNYEEAVEAALKYSLENLI